mgnify:CR=1 FL=1
MVRMLAATFFVLVSVMGAVAQERAVASSQRAANLAKERYESGISNYLEVVDANRATLAAQRIRAQLIGQRLIAAGMNWWQALLTIGLGNLIVLVPILLNAHPGTAYGIPFPVLARASFGTRGRAKASKAASVRARVSWRARSARKFMKTTTSPSARSSSATSGTRCCSRPVCSRYCSLLWAFDQDGTPSLPRRKSSPCGCCAGSSSA